MASKKLRKSTVTAGIATGPLLLIVTWLLSQIGAEAYAQEVSVVVVTIWGIIVSLLEPKE